MNVFNAEWTFSMIIIKVIIYVGEKSTFAFALSFYDININVITNLTSNGFIILSVEVYYL